MLRRLARCRRGVGDSPTCYLTGKKFSVNMKWRKNTTAQATRSPDGEAHRRQELKSLLTHVSLYNMILSVVEIHELDNWRAQLRKGALELVVLSALANGERYGLAVVEDLRRALGEEISEGTVYPLLNRLKQNGWLRSRWEESEAGHPRKYYSLTVEGARQLGRMLAEWEELSRRMGDHLAATTSRPPGREK